MKQKAHKRMQISMMKRIHTRANEYYPTKCANTHANQHDKTKCTRARANEHDKTKHAHTHANEHDETKRAHTSVNQHDHLTDRSNIIGYWNQVYLKENKQGKPSSITFWDACCSEPTCAENYVSSKISLDVLSAVGFSIHILMRKATNKTFLEWEQDVSSIFTFVWILTCRQNLSNSQYMKTNISGNGSIDILTHSHTCMCVNVWEYLYVNVWEYLYTRTSTNTYIHKQAQEHTYAYEV